MNTIDTLPVSLIQRGISIQEPGGSSFPELNSPALIILKTGAVSHGDLCRLGSFLSKEEKVKSLRFRFARDRKSYTVVHGILRWMLGRHFGIPPGEVKINYNSYGKPSVSGYPREMFFNLSHSSGVSVLAFDPEHAIGADVEGIDESFGFEPIVHHFFSLDEGQYIFGTEEISRQRFYEIWTRKEALMKAVGVGITENLHFEVLNGKINGNALAGQFSFRSVMFEKNFRITLAMGLDSGNIPAFVIGNDENRLTIFDS
jgi:phosphopantetheinyl transferase